MAPSHLVGPHTTEGSKLLLFYFFQIFKRCTSRLSKFTYIFLRLKNRCTILIGIISKDSAHFDLNSSKSKLGLLDEILLQPYDFGEFAWAPAPTLAL
jgi:hypothetical protein